MVGNGKVKLIVEAGRTGRFGDGYKSRKLPYEIWVFGGGRTGDDLNKSEKHMHYYGLVNKSVRPEYNFTLI